MRILWIYNLPLIPEAGGTERITSLVAKGLTGYGHTCLGILEFKQHSDEMIYQGKSEPDLYKFLREHKVDVVINQIAYDKWLLERFLEKGGGRWRREGGKIISCLHFDPKNPSSIQFLKSVYKPTFNQRLQLCKQYILRPYYKNLQEKKEGENFRYVYENSDSLVCLSGSHIPYMLRVMGFKDHKKLIAINNPLTFEGNLAEDEIDNKQKIVMVCARMSEYHKRISLILKGWKRIKGDNRSDGWVLKLVGDGPDLFRYKEYVANHKIKDVEFLGSMNPLPIYQKASILLVTSSAEGWGLTITEAMQNGVVPVVMDSSTVFHEIITDCYSGYITPNNDVKSFANIILNLMHDSERLIAMQKNALADSHRFNFETTMDKWQQLITKL